MPQPGRQVAIAGVGYSPVLRKSDYSVAQLAVLASLAALEDAGIGPKEVDGISQYGFPMEMVTAWEMAETIGIPSLQWYMDASTNSPAGITGVLDAAAAVASGSSEVCLAYRAVSRVQGHSGGRDRGAAVPGDMQFSAPYGNFAAPQWLAMYAARHMHEFGTKEEDFGAIAVAQREFAALNERAIFRQPITMDDYLASRYISEPVRLLDCDLPVDGAGAVIVTTAERARSMKQPPALLDAWAFGTGPRPQWFQWPDMTNSAPIWAANAMWGRSQFEPKDVDTAQLYDGFTIITMQWLEALGFCGRGEAGPFVSEGHTRLGGTLPTNTNGGMLNIGRVHGISHVIEAVEQLRGTCGPRQTPNAKVAVAANAGGPMAGCLIMCRE